MDNPISCLSFSPNWFFPHIVAMNGTYLAYGANDIVYVQNHLAKAFNNLIQLPHKITLLHFDHAHLYIAQAGGVIAIHSIHPRASKFEGQIELNMNHILLMKALADDHFLIFDDKGVGIQVQIKNYKLATFKLYVIN